MSQRALCRTHAVDLKQVKDSAQHRKPTANDRTTFVLEAFELQAFGLLRFDHALLQPVKRIACDQPLGPASGQQNICDCTDGAR